MLNFLLYIYINEVKLRQVTSYNIAKFASERKKDSSS